MLLISLFKVARERFKSPEHYVKFQRFQAHQIIENSPLMRDSIRGKKILDLGSGESAGYAMELAQYAGKVYALDLNIPENFPTFPNIVPVKANAQQIPFEDNTFDFCFCSSLIEHVPDKKKVLQEIIRVLAPGHYCYLSFPPFYSPVGGHQFKPFHYLPEKACLRVCKKIRKIDCTSYSDSFGNWGLYPTTISQVKRLANDTGFTAMSVTTRFLPLNFARIPLLNEVLTWHVEFLLRKGATT